MKKNYFTNEQQEQLRANPYIEKVSDTTITYTKEFRETFRRNIKLENSHLKS